MQKLSSPFWKALFSSPVWVIWRSPTPGLGFCVYLTPALSLFQQDICLHFFPLFTNSSVQFLPSPFLLKAFRLFCSQARPCSKCATRTLGFAVDSTKISYSTNNAVGKAKYWKPSDFGWKIKNKTHHNPKLKQKKKMPNKLAEMEGLGFFTPKIDFKCNDTVLLVGGQK